MENFWVVKRVHMFGMYLFSDLYFPAVCHKTEFWSDKTLLYQLISICNSIQAQLSFRLSCVLRLTRKFSTEKDDADELNSRYQFDNSTTVA